MKKKRALILGSGGLRGAYSAGFMIELCREVGCNFFDSIYCLSVGTTAGSFYVANQPEMIEKTWTQYVDGFKLVKPLNFIFGKPTLDLDYLISLFKGKYAHLNVKAVTSSKVKLRFMLIDYNTAEIVVVKPNKNNIFSLMKAACSLPIVTGPSKVNKRLFFDAAFIRNGIPFLEHISKEHDETIILLNFPRAYKSKPIWQPLIRIIFPLLSYLYPKQLQKVFMNKWSYSNEVFEYAKKDKKIKIIAPNDDHILNSAADANKERINALLELGKNDAKKFIKSYS